MARIITTRPSRAVVTLGRADRVLCVDGAGDGPALDEARHDLRATLRDWLNTHTDVTSIQVVAAARYGGHTVESYDRSDLVS